MCIPVNDYFIINLSFATRWAIQVQASDAGSGWGYSLRWASSWLLSALISLFFQLLREENWDIYN
jgi:hypothetical protein